MILYGGELETREERRRGFREKRFIRLNFRLAGAMRRPSCPMTWEGLGAHRKLTNEHVSELT